MIDTAPSGPLHGFVLGFHCRHAVVVVVVVHNSSRRQLRLDARLGTGRGIAMVVVIVIVAIIVGIVVIIGSFGIVLPRIIVAWMR